MRDIHPSSSASDGLVIEQSRYIKNVDRPDNVIRCAQCGFYVDLNKRATGDSLGAIGNATAATATIVPPKPGISQTDSYADPVDTMSGCPFCNTLNSRGLRRDALFGNTINLENL